MKKRNMKWKKSESIENMKERHNIWYIGRATDMNMING